MKKEGGGISMFFAVALVLWPAALWLVAFAVAFVAGRSGCKIWARGPEECMVLGMDIGEYLYPLWAMGYYMLGVILWIPIGFVLLILIWLARRKSVR